MLNMNNWETKNIDVINDIYLDPKNIRIGNSEDLSEDDLMDELFKYYKVMDLVKSIVTDGFLTIEQLIVVERNGILYVAEGNRRTAALKAIQNPELAPRKFRNSIKKLTNNIDISGLGQISVIKAPSQDDADRVIATLHTSKQRLPWGPVQQAEFFMRKMDEGKTAQDLIDEYPNINVPALITRGQIIKLIKSVEYSDEQILKYVHGNKFSFSTLERLYKRSDFLEVIGVEVTKTGEIEPSISAHLFSKILAKIINDVLNKEIDTRKLNKGKEQEKYVDSLREFKSSIVESPDYKEGEKLTLTSKPKNKSVGRKRKASGSPLGEMIPGLENEGKSSIDSPKKPTQSPSKLNMDGINIPNSYPDPIKKIHKELETINFKNFPNATTDLLRTYLEKIIKSYADISSKKIPNKNNQGFVQLDACLIWLESEFKAGPKKGYIQSINKLRGIKNNSFVESKEHLDALNHNFLISADPQDVTYIWDTMKEIVKGIFR